MKIKNKRIEAIRRREGSEPSLVLYGEELTKGPLEPTSELPFFSSILEETSTNVATRTATEVPTETILRNTSNNLVKIVSTASFVTDSRIDWLLEGLF